MMLLAMLGAFVISCKKEIPIELTVSQTERTVQTHLYIVNKQ